MPVKDGPSCPGCGLANHKGLCPVCRGDETAARNEGMPYPWRDEHCGYNPSNCPYGDACADCQPIAALGETQRSGANQSKSDDGGTG